MSYESQCIVERCYFTAAIVEFWWQTASIWKKQGVWFWEKCTSYLVAILGLLTQHEEIICYFLSYCYRASLSIDESFSMPLNSRNIVIHNIANMYPPNLSYTVNYLFDKAAVTQQAKTRRQQSRIPRSAQYTARSSCFANGCIMFPINLCDNFTDWLVDKQSELFQNNM